MLLRAKRRGLAGTNEADLLGRYPRMPSERMVDVQPKRQPNKPEYSGEHKRPTPTKGDRDPGNNQGRQGSADAGATVEDSDGKTALFAREPLGDRLAGAGPIEAFSDPQQKSKRGETENRTSKTREYVYQRPEAYRQRQTEPDTDYIEEDTSKEPRNRIGDLKSAENPRQVRVAEVVLTGEHRGKHGECLPADVIGNRRKKQSPDDPP